MLAVEEDTHAGWWMGAMLVGVLLLISKIHDIKSSPFCHATTFQHSFVHVLIKPRITLIMCCLYSSLNRGIALLNPNGYHYWNLSPPQNLIFL